MSTFGQTLRQAREAKGLSTSEVAQETHILVQIIEAMENEDFHRIPAAIYGRGFVKAYAACVDLDPQPLIREFMDIYEGRRAPTVQVRTVPPPPPVNPPPAVIPEPAPLWDPPPPIAPMPAPEPVAIPEPEPVAAPEPGAIPEPEPVAAPEPVAIPVPDPVAAPEPVAIPVPDPVAAPEPVAIPEPEVSATIPEASGVPEHLWDPPAPAPIPEPPLPVSHPDPVAETVEPPPVVRGLDLFEQAAATSVPPRSTTAIFPEGTEDPLFSRPAPVAPEAPAAASSEAQATPRMDAFDESPFLPTNFEDNGPSAAERFRTGLSSVSKGVLKSVRGIPRSAWRIALLALAAACVLALLVFGCVKLYQATSTIPKDPCADGSCEFDPKAGQPAAAKEAKAASTAKPADKSPGTAKPAAKPQETAKPAAKTAQASAPAKAAPKGPVKLRSTGPNVPALYAD